MKNNLKINSRKAWRIVRFTTSTVLTFIVTSHFAFAEGKITRRLQAALDTADRPLPVLVMLKQLPPMPHNMFGKVAPSQVETIIKKRTLALQASLRKRVEEMRAQSFDGGASVRRTKFFWTVNAFMATATPEAITEFAERDDVVAIELDYSKRNWLLGPQNRPAPRPRPVMLDGAQYTYGLTKIGVPELREKNSEVNGHGVVMGILDTGIDAKHPEFAGKNIVFKDFIDSKTEPYDDHGHGTHVAGTISGIGAGGTQIGVAPGIDHLVIGKVFDANGGGSLSNIVSAMQWVADPDGNAETKDAPRIVSNSWGGSMGDDVDADPFNASVLTWVQLNIFPSFAAGNEGPGPSSVGSPGGLPQAFAVGATDGNDAIARFSSRGPVDAKQGGRKIHYTKPDVSAPGVKVISSMPGGEYGEMSGTSMATPHNSGAAALLVQVKPDLTVPQIRELLMKSADDKGPQGIDNDFGAGRINVLKGNQLLVQKISGF